MAEWFKAAVLKPLSGFPEREFHSPTPEPLS